MEVDRARIRQEEMAALMQQQAAAGGQPEQWKI
jgi:hypothetical protein